MENAHAETLRGFSASSEAPQEGSYWLSASVKSLQGETFEKGTVCWPWLGFVDSFALES